MAQIRNLFIVTWIFFSSHSGASGHQCAGELADNLEAEYQQALSSIGYPQARLEISPELGLSAHLELNKSYLDMAMAPLDLVRSLSLRAAHEITASGLEKTDVALRYIARLPANARSPIQKTALSQEYLLKMQMAVMELADVTSAYQAFQHFHAFSVPSAVLIGDRTAAAIGPNLGDLLVVKWLESLQNLLNVQASAPAVVMPGDIPALVERTLWDQFQSANSAKDLTALAALLGWIKPAPETDNLKMQAEEVEVWRALEAFSADAAFPVFNSVDALVSQYPLMRHLMHNVMAQHRLLATGEFLLAFGHYRESRGQLSAAQHAVFSSGTLEQTATQRLKLTADMHALCARLSEQ